MSKLLRILGTLAFSILFASAAVNHILNFEGMTGYTAQSLTKYHLQHLATPAHAVATGLLVVGALGTLLGIFNGNLRRLGALAIAIFLIGVTPLVHDFWNYSPGPEQQMHQAMFFKNLSLIGASLIILQMHTHHHHRDHDHDD